MPLVCTPCCRIKITSRCRARAESGDRPRSTGVFPAQQAASGGGLSRLRDQLKRVALATYHRKPRQRRTTFETAAHRRECLEKHGIASDLLQRVCDWSPWTSGTPPSACAPSRQQEAHPVFRKNGKASLAAGVARTLPRPSPYAPPREKPPRSRDDAEFSFRRCKAGPLQPNQLHKRIT